MIIIQPSGSVAASSPTTKKYKNLVNKGYYYNNRSDGSVAAQTVRIQYTAVCNLYAIVLQWISCYMDDRTTSLTTFNMRAVVVANSIYIPVTFAGRDNINVIPGSIVTSDSVGVEIAEGGTFEVRVFTSANNPIANPGASLSLTASGTGSAFGASSVYVSYDLQNGQGANTTTVGSSAANVAVTAGQNVTTSITLPPNATSVGVYVGTAANPVKLATVSNSGAITYSGTATTGLAVTVSGNTLNLTISGPAVGGSAASTVNSTTNPSWPVGYNSLVSKNEGLVNNSNSLFDGSYAGAIDGRGFNPSAVLAVPAVGARTTDGVICIGDSIQEGVGALEAQDSEGNFFLRALNRDKWGWINTGVNGQDSLGWAASSRFNRILLAENCGYAIVEMGTNDIFKVSGGRTLANIQSYLQNIWSALKYRGLKVYQTTITPNNTTSTDGFTSDDTYTTNNQSKGNASNEAARTQLNDWIRTTAVQTGLIDGYFEVADVVETSRNSGYWKAFTTNDGLHPNRIGHRLISNYMDINTTFGQGASNTVAKIISDKFPTNGSLPVNVQSGQPWVSTGGGSWSISGGQLSQTGNVTASLMVDQKSTEHFVRATITGVPTAGQAVGVYVRGNTNTDGYMLLQITPTQAFLTKKNPGGATSNIQTASYTAGATTNIMVTMLNNVIEVRLNGVNPFASDYTMSGADLITHAGLTGVGLYNNKATGVTISNFSSFPL